jgi:hypothetical protein
MHSPKSELIICININKFYGNENKGRKQISNNEYLDTTKNSATRFLKQNEYSNL